MTEDQANIVVSALKECGHFAWYVAWTEGGYVVLTSATNRRISTFAQGLSLAARWAKRSEGD